MKIANPDFKLVDGERVYLWQYCNALRLNSILKSMTDFYQKDVEQFVSDWYKDVFNLKTANSFGLNIWGRILGAPRPTITPQNFGIDANGAFRFKNANTGTWHSVWLSGVTPQINVEKNPVANPTLYPILLDDETYRLGLLAKLFLLNSNASIADINKFLKYLFPNKVVYVQDNYNMTMSIIFEFVPTQTDLTIITYEPFSPRPMGVYMDYGIKILDKNIFSLQGMDLGTWGTNENTLDPSVVEQGLGVFYNI